MNTTQVAVDFTKSVFQVAVSSGPGRIDEQRQRTIGDASQLEASVRLGSGRCKCGGLERKESIEIDDADRTHDRAAERLSLVPEDLATQLATRREDDVAESIGLARWSAGQTIERRVDLANPHRSPALGT